jgi:cytochrome P450
VAIAACDQALQSQLRAAPERIPAALEELLRLYAPNQAFCRTPAHDTQLQGQELRAREPVVLSKLLARARSFTLAGKMELSRWPEYGPHVLPLKFELASAGGVTPAGSPGTTR